MQTSTRQYLYNYDLLRGLAILLVAVQHAWSMSEMDTDSWGLLCYGYRTIVNCGVPLFVVLSGALLLDAPIRPMSDFFRRRFSRILFPFLIWATAVYLLSFVTHKYEDMDSWLAFFGNYIPYLLTNRINDAHWFVHMILVLYLLAPFLQRAFTLCDRNSIRALLLVWIVVMIFRSFFTDVYVLRYTSGLFVYLGCFIAGYYIHHYKLNQGNKWIPLVVFALLAVKDVLTRTMYPYVEPFMAVTLFGLFSNFPMSTPPRGCKPLLLLSRYSFMLYLIHIPVIRVLLTVAGSELSPERPFVAFFQPLWLALAAMLICGLGCWILEKIGVPAKILRLLGITA